MYQLISEKKITAGNQVSIDTIGLKPGLYIVKIDLAHGESFSRKLFVN